MTCAAIRARRFKDRGAPTPQARAARKLAASQARDRGVGKTLKRRQSYWERRGRWIRGKGSRPAEARKILGCLQTRYAAGSKERTGMAPISAIRSVGATRVEWHHQESCVLDSAATRGASCNRMGAPSFCVSAWVGTIVIWPSAQRGFKLHGQHGAAARLRRQGLLSGRQQRKSPIHVAAK